MSASCFFQRISPRTLDILKTHPGVVDLFQNGSTLQHYSDDYWEAVEAELQEHWDMIDEECGAQPRITRTIYDQIESELPEIIVASQVESCWLGSYDSFNWLAAEGLVATEIGNDEGYGRLSFLTSEQVKTMNQVLESFRGRNFADVFKILYPQSGEPNSGSAEESEFWTHFDNILAYCRQAIDADDSMLLFVS